MQQGSVSRSYGPQGLAQVSVLKQVIRVMMSDNKQVFEFPKEAAPAYLAQGSFKAGPVLVKLSEKSDKIISAAPYEGSFVVKFKTFPAGKDQLPFPKRNQKPGRTKDGRTYPRDFLQFFTVHEVQEGSYAGFEIFDIFLYFEKGKGFTPTVEPPGMTMLSGSGAAVQKVKDWLVAAGVWDYDIPYSENILPTLGNLFSKYGQAYKLTIDKGWPASYDTLPKGAIKKKGK